MTTIDELATRLDTLVAAMESAGVVAPAALAEPVPLGALPPRVASGELITSAWGNAVVDELTHIRGEARALSTTFVGAGGTSGGGIEIASGFIQPQAVAGLLMVWSHTRVDVSSGTSYNLTLALAGTTVASWAFYTFQGFYMVAMQGAVATTAGVGTQINVRGGGTANVQVYADPTVNRVDTLWLPARNV